MYVVRGVRNMLKLGVCDDDKAVCEWLRQKLLHYGEMCGEPLEIYCYLSENASNSFLW